MSGIVSELVQNYNPYDDNNRTLENAWDYVQLQVSCYARVNETVVLPIIHMVSFFLNENILFSSGLHLISS